MPLAALASRMSNIRGPASAEHCSSPRRAARPILSGARVALVRVQSDRPAWTRAELMRQVKASTPAELFGADPQATVAL